MAVKVTTVRSNGRVTKIYSRGGRVIRVGPSVVDRARVVSRGGAVTRAGVIISPQQVLTSQTRLSQTLANLKRLELAKRDIEAGKSIAEAYAGRRTVSAWLQTSEGKRALAEASTAAKIQYELIAQREAAAKAEIARREAEVAAKLAAERAAAQRLITLGVPTGVRPSGVIREPFLMRPPAPGETIMIPGATFKELQDIRLGRKTQQQVIKEMEQKRRIKEVKRRVAEAEKIRIAALPIEKKKPKDLTNEELKEMIRLQTIEGRLPDPKYTKELRKRELAVKYIEPVARVAPRVERWLEEVTTTPQLRFERNVLKKESKSFDIRNKKFETSFLSYEKDSKAFAVKYLNRDLSLAEYKIASKTQETLERRRQSLLSEQEGLNSQLKGIERLEKSTGEILKKRPRWLRAATAFAGGFIGAPLGVATLGLGLLIRPREMLREVGVGLRREVGVPTMEDVARVAGGVAFFQLAATALVAGFRRAAPIKAGTSQSWTYTKARRVGKIKGKSYWLVDGKVETRIMPYGKPSIVIKTDTFSTVTTSPTKAGAIYAQSRTWASSMRKLAKSVKGVKVEVYLTRSEGTVTFSPTDTAKLWRGEGLYLSKEIRRTRAFLTKAGVTKVKALKADPITYQAWTDIYARDLGLYGQRYYPVTKRIPGVTRLLYRGKEYRVDYQSLTQIFGTKRGELLLRAAAKGEGVAIVPAKWFVKRSPIQALARADVRRLGLKPAILEQEMPAFAEAMVGPEISAIGRELAVRTALLGRVKPALAPALAPAVALALTTRQRQELKAQQLAYQTMFGLAALERVKPAVVPAYATALAISPAVAQRLKVVPAPVVPIPPAPPITPLVVPVPVVPVGIPIFPIKKETEAEKKRRKAREAKLRAMRLAYQASVGAVALGIAVTPEQARRLELERKKFVGLELRPVIRQPSRQVSALRAVQGALLAPAYGTARKGSPRKTTKALRKKQFELTAPAYATAKRTYTTKKVKVNGKTKIVKVRGPTRGVQMLNLQQSLLNTEMLQYAKGHIAKKKTKKQKKEKRRKTANIARLLLG